MRLKFAELLHKEMAENENIHLICADLGYFILDEIFKDFPDRAINVQAAEQAMIGVGIGLALAGKIPVCYSITPFILHRPYEAIKLYLEHENIAVKLVGSGRYKDYKQDGISHWIKEFPFTFDNIVPKDKESLSLKEFLYNGKPAFLSLSR